jgi:hypothetical protein
MVMSPAGLGPKYDCAGESQKQLRTTDPSFHQRGYHIMTMTARVQLEKNVADLESQGAWRQDESIGVKRPVVE